MSSKDGKSFFNDMSSLFILFDRGCKNHYLYTFLTTYRKIKLYIVKHNKKKLDIVSTQQINQHKWKIYKSVKLCSSLRCVV